MKYFGTDGIRGRSEFFSAELLEKIAGGLVGYLGGSGRVVIARDTRTSGNYISKTLAALLSGAGIFVYDTGICPTPVCSFLTRALGCDLGVVISASHNPPEYNGIKIFSRCGEKLADEKLLEHYIDTTVLPSVTTSKSIKAIDGAGLYIEFIKTVLDCDLSGQKIVLDTANGATSVIAPKLFSALGAEVLQINSDTHGENINLGCGATDLSSLIGTLSGTSTLGISFDGDGDRLMAVSGGKVFDGDKIMYLLAKTGTIKTDAVVGTIMTNLGTEIAFTSSKTRFLRSRVGDKYVYEDMKKHSINIGGETSGHIILSDYQPTGDGLLAAVLFAQACKNYDLHSLDDIISYPQAHSNISPATEEQMQAVLELTEISEYLKTLAKQLTKSDMRAVVRASGTEPVIRIMVEAKCESAARKTADKIRNEILDLLLVK